MNLIRVGALIPLAAAFAVACGPAPPSPAHEPRAAAGSATAAAAAPAAPDACWLAIAGDAEPAPPHAAVLFSAAWSGPGRVLAKLLDEQIPDEIAHWSRRDVDVDAELAAVQACAVGSVPTLLAFDGGRIAGRLDGAIPAQDVAEFLQKARGVEQDPPKTRSVRLEDQE